MSEAASTSNIVLFESSDGEVRLDVAVDAGKDEIWLNRSQMSLLFGRDVKTIGNLDVIISVGYRVKSQRGVEFRRWATDVLRRYIVEGRAENEKRLIDGLSSCSCP